MSSFQLYSIFNAIECGDLPAVQDWIARAGGAEPTHGSRKLTPLMHAIECGFTPAVQALVPHSDLEKCDREGQTVLLLALGASREDDVALLLEAGANVHVQDPLRSTPLMLAAQQGLARSVHLLLEKHSIPEQQAAVAQRNAFDTTAIEVAIRGLNTDRATISLKVGEEGTDVESPYIECVRALLRVSPEAPHNCAVWESAIGTGNQALLLALLDGGLDPNACSPDGRNALMHAVVKGDVECARLLQPRCEPGAVDRNGLNALMLASLRYNSTGEMTHLLAHSQEARAHDADGETALMIAIDQGHPQQVRILLEFSDVNAVDGKGRTPLMHAIRGDWKLGWTSIPLLIALSDSAVCDREGRTAADYAWDQVVQTRFGNQTEAALVLRSTMDVFAPLWSPQRLEHIAYSVKEGQMPRCVAHWERWRLEESVRSSHRELGQAASVSQAPEQAQDQTQEQKESVQSPAAPPGRKPFRL